MRPIPKLLSKTKLLRGYRCLKSFYLTIHKPQLETPITADQQAVFDQGNRVGELARTRFGGGRLVDHAPWDFSGSLQTTRSLIASGTQTIFEAAFEHRGFYARADVIQFNAATGRWNVFEVKSSMKLKREQLEDVGLQTWIMTQSGLPIDRIHVLHLNPECTFPNLENLFLEVDVTDSVREEEGSIEAKLDGIFAAIQKPEVPAIDIGPHCVSPRDCGFKQACWEEKKIPALSIFDMPQIKDRKWEFYRAGVIELTDPRVTGLTPIQQRVAEAHRSGARFVERLKVTKAISSWKFPLIFLDFETINPAIPRYKGTPPYEHVPFQFSVHVWRTPQSPLEHREFLHTEKTDPRDTLIPQLLEACESEGSIVAYYAEFESLQIEKLAQYSPNDSERLRALLSRMVDPLPILRESIYDPQFGGRFGLKYVAPALLGQKFSYDGMAVANGLAVQRAFEELISDKTSEQRKTQLKASMLEYCRQDTLVMVELVKWLWTLAPPTQIPLPLTAVSHV